MKPYTENEPVFSESIQITEPTDPAHADNINAAPKQLLQNTLANRKEIEELKQGNLEVEFDDSGASGEVPDPAEALEQIVPGKSVPALIGHIKRTLTGLLALSQRALNIAMGKNQARVFATVAALDAWLAVPANVQQLKVGDNFYITATDVPDYWWDGTQKQKLETQKVDLTTYDQRIAANASAISQLNGNISSLETKITSFEQTKSEIVASGLGTALGLIASNTWVQIVSKILKTIASNKKVSVANGWQFRNLMSFKVFPGVWILLVQAFWDGSGLETVGQNARGLYISTSASSVTNQSDERVVHQSDFNHQMHCLIAINAETTFYILARQNFSSALNVTINSQIVRLD